MEKKKSIRLASIFARGILSAILIFLFLNVSELSFSYLIYDYQLLSSKVLCYGLISLLIGEAFGVGFGAAVTFAAILKNEHNRIWSEFSTNFLLVTGFLGFYVFVILNAYYLSGASLLSMRSLSLNIFLPVLSVPPLLLLYKWGRRGGWQASTGRAVSTSFSVAVVLIVLHSSMTPRFDDDRPGLMLTGAIVYAYILAPLVVAGIENGLMEWLIRKKNSVAKGRIWAGSALVKVLGVSACLAVAFHVKHARPIIVEFDTSGAAAPKGAPNIILIVLDTVRQDRLSAYGCGRDTSPNIAGFAEQSLVFDAYAPSHWTLPSHASLVTGLYPTENGTALASNIVIDGENETLAEALVGSGYRAGAVIANFGVLSLDSGLPQGFNYYFTDTGEIMPPFPFMASYFLKKFRPNSRIFLFTPYMPASSVNRRAVKWIKKNYDRPFFLLLNYMDAHDPYLPPPPYDTMWNGRGLNMNFFDPHTRYIEYCSEINAGSRQVTSDEHDFLLSQYDGAISYLDEQVGKLLGKLREMGLYDNSIIVITSDHGEFFGEHNLLQHKASLYEEVIRVPLIVKLPAGQDQPAVQPSGPVSLVHLFHSILELAGIPHAGGRQDVDIFNGETAPVGAECHLEDGLANRFGNHTYCLIEKGAKLIISSNGTEELFDIQNDPAELDNLKEGHLPDQIESYEEFKARLGQRIEELNANAFKPAEISADKRLRIREKLKALGYIQ